jgi:hypothetical protein
MKWPQGLAVITRPEHWDMTIRQGNYLADIVTDRLNPGSAYSGEAVLTF